MTSLQRLRNFVGSRGDWDKFGICSLPFQTAFGITKTFLVCESGSTIVFESNYPDTTDVIEKISEARAKIVLEYFVKPKPIDLERELIP